MKTKNQKLMAKVKVRAAYEELKRLDQAIIAQINCPRLPGKKTNLEVMRSRESALRRKLGLPK